MTVEACRKACGDLRCGECPAPRLLPDAQTGVAAYLAVRTQWRHGFGGRTGMDYHACLTTLGTLLPAWRRRTGAFKGLKVTDLLEDVQIIEGAMLRADDERREAEEAERAIERAARGNA